ncbi:MAG: hypothetical protein MI748_14610 [Opitutales bacterium]|nr:hypothetical protein [Opitutales bacterium]
MISGIFSDDSGVDDFGMTFLSRSSIAPVVGTLTQEDLRVSEGDVLSREMGIVHPFGEEPMQFDFCDE